MNIGLSVAGMSKVKCLLLSAIKRVFSTKYAPTYRPSYSKIKAIWVAKSADHINEILKLSHGQFKSTSHISTRVIITKKQGIYS